MPINQARNSLNMIGRLLEGDSMGDEELPQFPARPVKAFDNTAKDETHPAKEATHAKEGHGLSLLTGLVGFLLGVLASQYLSRRSLTRHYSTASSDDSAFRPATEATPLHYADGA